MKTPFLLLASLLAPLAVLHAAEQKSAATDTLSLDGEWRFAIAPANAALFKSNLTDRVTLPGTTQTNCKGAEFKLPADQQKRVEADAETDIRHPLMSNWTPVHFNAGTAWYQRDVEIPAAWTGKRITLTMDRSKITHVWVDDKDCGSCDDIVTSHVYDLTDALTPGKHRLTILVTTGPFPRGVGGHHLGGMQGNWNGIIGRIELAATERTHIENVRVVPDVARKTAQLRIAIANPAPASCSSAPATCRRCRTNPKPGSFSRACKTTLLPRSSIRLAH